MQTKGCGKGEGHAPHFWMDGDFMKWCPGE